MANSIPFDLQNEKQFSSTSGLAADFWKGTSVDVLLQTWSKELENKSTTTRTKGGTGSLGCWLVDSVGNKGWANLSALGTLMYETLSKEDKKDFFEKKNGVLHVILDSEQRLTIEMDNKDRPKIVKVSKPVSLGNDDNKDDDL